MAVVDILTAFGYKWGQDGTVEALDDAQYKAGWSFVGTTPPSVEQFNKVHQIADEKANYLYAQMASIFTAAGETPSAGDFNSLRDALAALYRGGRFIKASRFTASGTWTPDPATKIARVRMIGGGGAGGGAIATGAGAAGAGLGGSAGAFAEFVIVSGLTSTTVTVGGGGSPASGAAGNNGGNSIFGSFCTAAGGVGGGAFGPTGVSFLGNTQSNNAAPAVTGAIPLVVSSGQLPASPLIILSSSLIYSGQGASSIYGTGGSGQGSGEGGPALGYGSGGGGSANGQSTAARPGGSGAAGLVIVEELS